MKTITSLGGPLIGINRAFANHWSGIDGKQFVGDTSPFSSDYEAAGDLISGRGKPPCNIAKSTGRYSEALLVAPPVETAFVMRSNTSIFLAQIEAAEPDWSFSNLSKADFDRANFSKRPTMKFMTKNCSFVLFDSASAWDWVKNEFIEFELEQGCYFFSRLYMIQIH